ncbi:MAG: hypothetical protein NZ108_00445, partial [Bacteroidia bacterium]|nr:hypothetical protein [Bacteroidia bacterium]
MKGNQIFSVVEEFCKAHQQEIDILGLRQSFGTFLPEGCTSVQSFLDSLIEIGGAAHLTFLVNAFSESELEHLVQNKIAPFLIFIEGSELKPELFIPTEKNWKHVTFWEGTFQEDFVSSPLELIKEIHKLEDRFMVVTCYPIKSFLTHKDTEEKHTEEERTPIQRLLRLISLEGKDITHLYVYAIITGLLSLNIPLGIQSIVNLVSGG